MTVINNLELKRTIPPYKLKYENMVRRNEYSIESLIKPLKFKSQTEENMIYDVQGRKYSDGSNIFFICLQYQ